MAASFNNVQLMGTLTRDPEFKSLNSGASVCEFSIAVNESYKGKDGKKTESVDYFDLTAFGRIAEVVREYCAKGSSVFVAGRLKQERWESKDGQKRSKIKVMADRVQLVGGKPKPNDNAEYEQKSDESVPF